jgi:hypothetical protein
MTSLPPPGTSVEFCIRPEDVRLVWSEKATERFNVLRGHLTAEVERGVDYLLKFRGDGQAVEAGEIEIHCSEHLHYLMKLHPGKQVFIAFPPDKLHMLSPADER